MGTVFGGCAALARMRPQLTRAPVNSRSRPQIVHGQKSQIRDVASAHIEDMQTLTRSKFVCISSEAKPRPAVQLFIISAVSACPHHAHVHDLKSYNSETGSHVLFKHHQQSEICLGHEQPSDTRTASVEGGCRGCFRQAHRPCHRRKRQDGENRGEKSQRI